MMRDIRNLFELENKEENYYKPRRVDNLHGNDFIEYESNSDRNKMLLIEEYINKI